MKDPIRSNLDAIFKRYALSNQAKAKRISAVDDKATASLKQFATIRENVIRPAMEEMGEYVRAQGYAYTIDTEGEGVRPDGTHNNANIRLTFYFDAKRAPSEDYPGLTVFCDKSRGLAQFHMRTFAAGRHGRAGLIGEFDIADVTRELVQEKILAVIAEAFR